MVFLLVFMAKFSLFFIEQGVKKNKFKKNIYKYSTTHVNVITKKSRIKHEIIQTIYIIVITKVYCM
jgi:hypothetical protein